eukprot:3810449-Karenia_brevis.AAC.1
MSPPCTPFANWSRYNRVMHYQSWSLSWKYYAPIAEFCGEIAYWQLSQSLHFLCEQPDGSDLYDLEPWLRCE